MRYADVHLPMDETLTRVAIDVSGRPFLIWRVEFLGAESSARWTPSFSANGSRPSPRMPGITLHVENLYGENNHHIAETCYKGLARALKAAIAHRSATGGPHSLDQGNARGLKGSGRTSIQRRT